MMMIDFDPAKNEKNIQERGLSFELVQYLDWDSAIVWHDDRKNYGEERNNALALMPMDGKLYAVTFTIRGDVVWIISFRRANKRERRKYDDR